MSAVSRVLALSGVRSGSASPTACRVVPLRSGFLSVAVSSFRGCRRFGLWVVGGSDAGGCTTAGVCDAGGCVTAGVGGVGG